MKTILLQDRDEDILDILSLILRDAGYIVHVISVLDEHILELVAEAKPHAVIVDYLLSGEDAIHACKLIRAFYPNLPVIATSCNCDIKNEYQIGGFDDYLAKPFELEALNDLIRKHLYSINT